MKSLYIAIAILVLCTACVIASTSHIFRELNLLATIIDTLPPTASESDCDVLIEKWNSLEPLLDITIPQKEISGISRKLSALTHALKQHDTRLFITAKEKLRTEIADILRYEALSFSNIL